MCAILQGWTFFARPTRLKKVVQKKCKRGANRRKKVQTGANPKNVTSKPKGFLTHVYLCLSEHPDTICREKCKTTARKNLWRADFSNSFRSLNVRFRAETQRHVNLRYFGGPRNDWRVLGVATRSTGGKLGEHCLPSCSPCVSGKMRPQRLRDHSQSTGLTRCKVPIGSWRSSWRHCDLANCAKPGAGVDSIPWPAKDLLTLHTDCSMQRRPLVPLAGVRICRWCPVLVLLSLQVATAVLPVAGPEKIATAGKTRVTGFSWLDCPASRAPVRNHCGDFNIHREPARNFIPTCLGANHGIWAGWDHRPEPKYLNGLNASDTDL